MGLNVAGMVRQATGGGAAGGPQRTDFAEIPASFAVSEGVARNDDLIFLGPLLRAEGAGSIDIGRRTLNYRLTPRAVPTLEGQGGRADGDRLAASVGAHLRRYFDLHGGVLPPPGLYQRILREVETPLIEIALDATGGNQAKCADLLGINRNTLRKKITELDIRVTRRRKLM